MISYGESQVDNPPDIIADATDSNGNTEALEIPVVIADGYIAVKGAPTLVTVSDLAGSSTSGVVTFTADDSKNYGLTFAESNLPGGLTSGNPTLSYNGGTAAPGTYGGVKVTATDTDGAVLNGTFTLTVSASSVSDQGDEINRFGNGFDSFRQHDYAGALIVGWPATPSDRGTQFILGTGTHAGAYRFEYAPKGSASGLCVSDPGGGWKPDPLRDGLILAHCNTGPYQQFVPQSDGTLKNVATGLYVNPDGKGAQLRGEHNGTASSSSSYTWTTEGNLPG